MEWKLFSGDVPFVSTFDYHKDRDRAPHIDQSDHNPRMRMALEFVCLSLAYYGGDNYCVADLGCGDGGFVAELKKILPLGSDIVGFDFTPDMQNGWRDRGVLDQCKSMTVFTSPPEPSPINPKILADVKGADVIVMTEVLEHLARPHDVLAQIAGFGEKDIVVSSPWGENNRHHDPSHAWAWDEEGYANMIELAGFDILGSARAGFSQVVRARSRG